MSAFIQFVGLPEGSEMPFVEEVLISYQTNLTALLNPPLDGADFLRVWDYWANFSLKGRDIVALFSFLSSKNCTSQLLSSWYSTGFLSAAMRMHVKVIQSCISSTTGCPEQISPLVLSVHAGRG